MFMDENPVPSDTLQDDGIPNVPRERGAIALSLRAEYVLPKHDSDLAVCLHRLHVKAHLDVFEIVKKSDGVTVDVNRFLPPAECFAVRAEGEEIRPTACT